MQGFEAASWRAAVVGRWTARIGGTLMFLLFLAFLIGEGPPNPMRLSFAQRLQAIGIIALFCGLPIAWKWEGLGGLITLGGFALLAALEATDRQRWFVVAAAITGALHFASWGRLKTAAPAELTPWHLPRVVTACFGGVFGVFLLLCANEIFGQPPVMAPTLHPGSALAGAWSGTGALPVELFIQSDGTVTGSIGNAATTESRILYGRSWFGKLLHINTTYRIVGKLSNDRWTAALDPSGSGLEGSVFRQNYPVHVVLTKQ